MFRRSAEPNALARALARRRAAGLPVCDLIVSNPTVVGLPYDEAAIGEALADPRALRYEPDPLGLPAARAAIAALERTTPDRVMLTATTSEAYSAILAVCCDPGDEVLVPAPSYPLIATLAELAHVRVVHYPLVYDGSWHVDFGRLRRTHRAKLCFAVSPNNPTGSVLSQDELDRLADLGLPVVLDEVFAFYTFRERSPARTDRVTTFRMGGLSKLALLPQMKLAWTIVSGPGAAEALRDLEHVSDAYLSASGPVQHAAATLIERTLPTRLALRRRLLDNLSLVRRDLAGTALGVLDVQGGWYATVRLPRIRTEEEWLLGLLDRGVLVHPGHFYDFEEEAYAVVSLLPEPAELARGVAILRQFAQ